MTDKKAYPLRISATVLDAVQRWAEDDLRSVNAQIEYLLRDALRRQGRLKRAETPGSADLIDATGDDSHDNKESTR